MIISVESLWVGSTIVAFLLNVVYTREQNEEKNMLSDKWKDIFVAGAAGKPTLGSKVFGIFNNNNNHNKSGIGGTVL